MKKHQWGFGGFKNIVELIRSFVYKFKSLSFAKSILLIYLFITLIGSLLLYSSFSQTGYISWDPLTNKLHRGEMSFLNSLFIAASAFSDTGLTTNTIAVIYNEIGQAIIAILIFVGGIGFFVLKVFLFNIIFNRPLSYKMSKMLAAERGSTKIGVTSQLVKVAVIFLFVMVFIFSIVLSVIFYYTDVSKDTSLTYDDQLKLVSIQNNKLIYQNPYRNPLVSIRFGIFHAISALNNAGFDIVGSNSLQPYYYVLSVQIIFLILFIIGGMGYPLIYDVYLYLVNKKSGNKFRFSLFTKLSITTYFLVATIGVGIAYWIEGTSKSSFLDNPLNNYGSESYKHFAIFFNTMSTRNAGFSTIDIHTLSEGTLLLYTTLMFIGSAPSSTGGGIRTTTLAVIFLAIVSFIRGRRNVYVFGRMIDNATVKRAFVVFVVSISIVLTGTIIMLSSLDTFGGQIATYSNVHNLQMQFHPNKNYYSYTEVLFEVGSAFGTTGLSSGITSQLSKISKITLILTMLIGQLGVSSSILIWGTWSSKDNRQKAIRAPVTIG